MSTSPIGLARYRKSVLTHFVPNKVNDLKGALVNLKRLKEDTDTRGFWKSKLAAFPIVPR
jgi:hypothetical protein